MLDLSQFSQKNLEEAQKILKVVLNWCQFSFNELTGVVKIPLKRFEKEGIDYYEVIGVIDGMNNAIHQLNESFKRDLGSFNSGRYPTQRYGELVILQGFTTKDEYLNFHNISEKDLKNCIILKIEDLNELKETKESIDRKLKDISKTRAEEVRRQFEYLDEKQKAFEELGKQISSRIQKDFLEEGLEKIAKLKKDEKRNKKKQIKEGTLYLNQNGDLYREPKDRYCYPMGEKSNRHKIIRFLVMNKGYQPTGFISTELGIESEKTIRTEIGKMRNNIKKYLKIDGKDFLQGKKESGYRINPKYKITFKNE